jgi:hypothetical protein
MGVDNRNMDFDSRKINKQKYKAKVKTVANVGKAGDRRSFGK